MNNTFNNTFVSYIETKGNDYADQKGIRVCIITQELNCLQYIEDEETGGEIEVEEEYFVAISYKETGIIETKAKYYNLEKAKNNAQILYKNWGK